MDVKLTVLIVFVTLGLLVNFSLADFFYNHPSPNVEDLPMLKLKCVPGRSILKVEENFANVDTIKSDSEEFTRRMYSETDVDERCNICVCSADGKDEYCYKRAVGSLNECMMIFNKNEDSDPFDHLKDLANRIRRVNGQDMEHWTEPQWQRNNQQGPQQQSSSQTCVPFVSQYTDCSDQNQCDGCTKCTCSKFGSWECQSVKICGNKAEEDDIDSDAFERAINRLDLEIKEAKPRAKYSASSPATGNMKSASEELMGYVVSIPRREKH